MTLHYKRKLKTFIFARCNRPEYPPAGLYPGLKRPRLDYTRVYYGLGQFVTPSGHYCTPMISTTISIVLSDILRNYLIFQQVTEDSALSGKISEKAKLTEPKS